MGDIFLVTRGHKINGKIYSNTYLGFSKNSIMPKICLSSLAFSKLLFLFISILSSPFPFILWGNVCLGIVIFFAAFEIQILQYCVKMQKLKRGKMYHNLFIFNYVDWMKHTHKYLKHIYTHTDMLIKKFHLSIYINFDFKLFCTPTLWNLVSKSG